ncbi:MAG: nitrous oxide reductase family maturation protein NosD [Bacteroidetes bacterium]|nr:nitrous oxide reductase family maturation protein NosD [Bacteroidota bacterium]
MNLTPLKFIFMIVFCLLFCRETEAKNIKVGATQQFKNLQQALTISDSGDTILLAKGIYKYPPLTITKPITILGEKGTVLDGANKYQTLTIKANFVTIKRIKFINSGKADMRDIAALKIQNSSNCKIENCEFVNNFFAIYLANCKKCFVLNNHILANYKKESASGNGIHLWKSSEVSVSGNYVEGHRDGIYFEFVTNSIITNNFSTKNIRYGLHFMFSNDNSYFNNKFIDNGSGVAVMYSHHIKMCGNTFHHNWGGAAYGLLLKQINYCSVKDNIFSKNTIGIYLEESNNIRFEGNKLKSNGWAMKMQSSCQGDTIIHNNFSLNTFDVATSGTLSMDLFSENYWDKFTGYDLNHDGIGDVPFRPASLSSIIMETIPNSIMFYIVLF